MVFIFRLLQPHWSQVFKRKRQMSSFTTIKDCRVIGEIMHNYWRANRELGN